MSYPMMLYIDNKPFHTVKTEKEHRAFAPQDFEPKHEPRREPPPAPRPIELATAELAPIADPVIVPQVEHVYNRSRRSHKTKHA